MSNRLYANLLPSSLDLPNQSTYLRPLAATGEPIQFAIRQGRPHRDQAKRKDT